MVKHAVILGTRSEIIKMSSVMRECERLRLDSFVLHTGQHYSYNMDKIFFEQLELPDVRNIIWMLVRVYTESRPEKCSSGLTTEEDMDHAYMQCVDSEKPYTGGGAVIFK